jgi:DNA-binding NarL/FixJ family response regulator
MQKIIGAEQDSIMIISENAGKAAEVAKVFTEKGYRIFIESPCADFKIYDTARLVLVVLVECSDTCIAVTEHLTQLSDSVSNIPIICMNEKLSSGKYANLEQVSLEEFLPKSVALEVLESRIQFWHNKYTQETTDKLKTLYSQLIEASCIPEDNDPIMLLVVSQRQALFDKLQTCFAGAPAISITRECIHRIELIPNKLEQCHPNVVLVDTEIALSDHTHSEWLCAIRIKDAMIKIILLQDHEIPNLIHEIIEFNVFGLIPSNASCDVYKKAVSVVHNGGLWMPHHVIIQIFNSFSDECRQAHLHQADAPKLSPREQENAELGAQGHTSKKIAERLKVSPETVIKKLKNIFDKSGSQSWAELVSNEPLETNVKCLMESKETIHLPKIQQQYLSGGHTAQGPSTASGSSTLLIVSGQKSLGSNIASLFRSARSIKVVDQCFSDLSNIAALLQCFKPTMVLLDVTTVTESLSDWLRAIRSIDNDSAIILLTAPDAPDYLDEMLANNVRGRLSTNDPTKIIRQALIAVNSGELWLSRQLMQSTIQSLMQSHANEVSKDTASIEQMRLTERELCIANLAADGFTNKEIGRLLHISPETVKKHLQHIFDKLGIHRRSQVASNLHQRK